MDKIKVAAATLGCKVNMYDTEAMLELFEQKGYEIVDFNSFADIYIINTCTVTSVSDKKSRQMIRRAKERNKNGLVAVCGCYAQVSPQEVKKIEGVDLIVGVKDRSGIVKAVEESIASVRDADEACELVQDIMHETEYENLSVTKRHDRTRAYVKIQDGCENFCSYCIIPYARGPVRSRRSEDVLDEISALAGNGYKEIVLAGIHVASYGNDLECGSLTELLYSVHEINGIERIRLSSIEPGAVTDEFVTAVKNLTKVCGHFHLSLQSGCDRTLSRMNRQYTAAEYMEAAERLKAVRPDCAFTTDIIAGFPGETDEDFLESYRFVESMSFARLHVFPYSPKKGTPAAEHPDQISPRVKDERAGKLLELGRRMEEAFINSFSGREMKVLFEAQADGMYTGHTDNYIEVLADSPVSVVNRIMPVVMGDCARVKQKLIAYCSIIY